MGLYLLLLLFIKEDVRLETGKIAKQEYLFLAFVKALLLIE
jgi:hypothetical protein